MRPMKAGSYALFKVFKVNLPRGSTQEDFMRKVENSTSSVGDTIQAMDNIGVLLFQKVAV